LNCGFGQGAEEICFEQWLVMGTRGELFFALVRDRDQRRAVLNYGWGQGLEESFLNCGLGQGPEESCFNCGWGQGTEESCFELWLTSGTRG